MRRILFGLCFLLVVSGGSQAQFVPDGCPGRWVQAGFGMACQCPDGSLASGWPMSCGQSMPQHNPNVVWCSHSTYCQAGQTCCGGQCCGAGSQCSSAGCVPQGSADCGNGQFCPPGRMCWRAPVNVGGLRKGQLSCPTPEDAAGLDRMAEERSAELKEEARRKREEEAARKKREAEEKKRVAAEAKFKADAPARKKVSELLTNDVWKQRDTELKKATQLNQQKMQQALAIQQKSVGQKLCDIAWDANTAQWKDCIVTMQPRAPTPLHGGPAPDPDAVRKQLEALAKGGDTALKPAPAAAPVPAPLTKQQFDYLKQNAAVLQPEQRTIPNLVVAPPSPDFAVCSTFPGTNSSKGNCPPPLTPEQAAAAKARQDKVAEEFRKAEAERKAQEEARYAEERAKEKKKEEEARARVYQVKDIDDSDCTGLAFRSVERESWCGLRGNPGLRRCEVITITKTCERRTLLPDHCVEISRIRQDQCR